MSDIKYVVRESCEYVPYHYWQGTYATISSLERALRDRLNSYDFCRTSEKDCYFDVYLAESFCEPGQSVADADLDQDGIEPIWRYETTARGKLGDRSSF